MEIGAGKFIRLVLVLTVHEPVAVGGEVGLADDEVEVGDDLDQGEERAVGVDAVHLDESANFGDLVVDLDPATAQPFVTTE